MRNSFLLPFLNSRYYQQQSIGMFFSGFLISILLISCSEPSIVGINVLPKNDLVNVKFDESQILKTITVREDSLRSDGTILNLLGSYTDPVFGKSTASFYTQVLLSKENPPFGTNPTIDSIVLTLAYNGFYGDTNTTQRIQVFELAEDIKKDSAYYSNKIFSIGNHCGTLTFNPHPTDSVLVDGTNTAPHLRMQLDALFGKKFLDASSTNFANNDNFLNFFKGIYVAADNITATNQGAILYFNLLSSQSKLTLYYKNTADDSLKFDFIMGTGAERVNHFVHDYTGTPVNATLNIDTDLVYVQTMSGVKTKIIMPNLKHLTDSGMIVINKAELVITVDKTKITNYAPPSKLLLARIDSTGKNDYVDDQNLGADYFGGTYDSAKGEYKFNLAKYIQEILTGAITDYGLDLLSSGAVVSANRAVVGGGSNTSSYKMKLKLTYTKI